MAMAEAIKDILEYYNYQVDIACDGQEALAYANSEHYDGIFLDIMMPKMDGLEVLQELRRRGNNTPVLLLTAKSEVEDRIAGLDMGADDYLAKPFVMGELLARVRAMLRRRETYTPEVLVCNDLKLNMQNCELSCKDKSFTLPKLEYQLMELLMLNQGIYLSSQDLFFKIWGYEDEGDVSRVFVYISYLRKRIDALGAHVKISRKRNTGYTLEKTND